MQISILQSAVEDLIHGFEFYERQGANLGSYFLDSLYSDIDSLLISAGVHQMHFRKYRLLSKRIPFAVYYTIQTETVLIHAVLDCRQNPRKTSLKLK